MSSAFDCILPQALSATEDLPTLPGAAVAILELCESNEAGLDDYAKVISTDPALSARILRLANSSLYSLGQDITSVARATMVLGTKTVQLMSLSFTLAEQMPNPGSSRTFDYSGYWRRSLIAAVAGRELGRMLGFSLADEAFLCGLLSRIGQLVLAESIPEKYDLVIQQSAGFPTRADEQALLGFDYIDVSSALMKAWGLPKPLYLAVAFTHAPDQVPETDSDWTPQLARITHLASLIVELLCSEEKGRALGELHEEIARVGLSSEQTNTLILALEARIAETAALLDIELTDAQSHYEILDTARKQLVAHSFSTLEELKEHERRSGSASASTQIPLTVRNTDELTGLGDRSFLEASLAVAIRTRMVSEVPEQTGILLVEIADYELIENQFGLSFAHQALSVVGQTLRGMCRATDTPARHGDHSFAILLPAAGPFSMRALSKRITDTISDMPIVAGQEGFRVQTVVGGGLIAEAKQEQDAERLLHLAEEALAKARRQGPGSTEILSA